MVTAPALYEIDDNGKASMFFSCPCCEDGTMAVETLYDVGTVIEHPPCPSCQGAQHVSEEIFLRETGDNSGQVIRDTALAFGFSVYDFLCLLWEDKNNS